MSEANKSNPPQAELSALKELFPARDVEWLPKRADAANRGQVFPYIRREAIEDRLDAAVGMGNWKAEYLPWQAPGEKGAQLCALSIRINGEWITKYDGAGNSEFEAVKGGITNAFKRAASCWGIGRYLRGFPEMIVQLEQVGKGYRVPPQSRLILDDCYNRFYFPAKAAGQPDYVIRNAWPDGNRTRMILYSTVDKQDYNALLDGVNGDLAEGVCLTDVILEPVRDSDYNLLRRYQIVA